MTGSLLVYTSKPRFIDTKNEPGKLINGFLTNKTHFICMVIA